MFVKAVDTDIRAQCGQRSLQCLCAGVRVFNERHVPDVIKDDERGPGHGGGNALRLVCGHHRVAAAGNDMAGDGDPAQFALDVDLDVLDALAVQLHDSLNAAHVSGYDQNGAAGTPILEFTGVPGAGKSTLVAALSRLGYRLPENDPS